MRRWFALTIITNLAVLGIWRACAGKAQAAAAEQPPAVASMSPAEWRYFNSQPAHWRQLLLRH